MIDLPDFGDSHSAAMIVCAHIQRVSKPIERLVKQLPSSDKAFVASFGKGKGACKIMLFGGGKGDGGKGHVHINLFKTQSISSTLKVNKQVQDIQQMLAQFAGCKAHIRFSTFFYVPVGDLPENGGIIQPALSLDAHIDDVVIRQNGAKLEILGGEVNSVEWLMRADRKEVRIELEAFRKAKIDKRYLAECFHLMHSAFQILVLGEVTHHE
jgi:hypothetical protein